jgi:hypothetical protein
MIRGQVLDKNRGLLHDRESRVGSGSARIVSCLEGVYKEGSVAPVLFSISLSSMIQSLYTLLCILLSQIDTMSFHASATDIKVEDGHILKADLYDENGDKVEASLDLNTIIGNNDG